MRRDEQQCRSPEEGWRRRRTGGAADWSRDPPLKLRGYSLWELGLWRVRWEQLFLKSGSLVKAYARAGRPLAKVNPLQKESGGKSVEQAYTEYQLCYYITTGLCQVLDSVITGPDVLADKETLVESPASFICCNLAVHMTGWGMCAKFIPLHHDHITEMLPLCTKTDLVWGLAIPGYLRRWFREFRYLRKASHHRCELSCPLEMPVCLH